METRRGGKPTYVLPLNPTDEEIKKYNHLQKRKEYRQKNKPKQYQESKYKYNEKHREEYLELMKEWYYKNKEKQLEKIKCEICGKQYTKCHQARHIRTQYHQKRIPKENVEN